MIITVDRGAPNGPVRTYYVIPNDDISDFELTIAEFLTIRGNDGASTRTSGLLQKLVGFGFDLGVEITIEHMWGIFMAMLDRAKVIPSPDDVPCVSRFMIAPNERIHDMPSITST